MYISKVILFPSAHFVCHHQVNSSASGYGCRKSVARVALYFASSREQEFYILRACSFIQHFFIQQALVNTFCISAIVYGWKKVKIYKMESCLDKISGVSFFSF